MNADRIVRAARILLVAALGGVIVGLLALSGLGYETLKDRLDPFSVDRNADITRAEFEEIISRLRILAAGSAVLAVLLLAFGRAIDRVVAEVARSWSRSLRAAPRQTREWLERESRPYIASLALIVLAAVALRLAYLDVPMRYDEATTYDNFVSKPFHVALANYATPNNHLLHTLLAKISVTVLGNEPWTIRLPALLAGLALVPATFALARVLYGGTAALLASALVASSSTLVEYSTNARGYTIVALLTLITFLAAARVLVRDSLGAWGVVAVAGALGLYAVPIMLYPLGGAFVWLLVSGRLTGGLRRPFLVRLGVTAVVATVVTLVLYAPVYAASGVRSVTANEFVEPQSLGRLLELFPDHLWDTVETWTRDLPLAASVLLAIGLVASLALTPWISRFPVPPLLAVIAWTVPVLALQRVVPFTRVWLFLLPIAIATCAGFYGWLLELRPAARSLGPPIAAIVALGASLVVLSADTVRESRETGALLDAPAIAAYLEDRVVPGDRILATGSDTILEYYLERDGVEAGALLYTTEPRPRTYVVVNVLGGQTIDELVGQLDAPGQIGPPELLRSFPSGQVYVVEPRS